MKISKSLNIGTELLAKAEESLISILSEIPNSSLELTHDRGGVDFMATLQTGYGLERLAVEVKSRARPDEIAWLADRFSLHQRVHGDAFVPVLIAPYVSASAADKCKSVGISWLDLVGNCEIRLSNSLIKVRGIDNPFMEKRGTASLFTPAASRVVHALLLDPKRKWKVEELASSSNVSTGQVSNVRKLLSNEDWIDAAYGSVTLKEPERLLAHWSEHYKPKRREVRLFTPEPFAELEARLEENLAIYAVTEFAAAERYASYARYQRFAFYTSEPWDRGSAESLRLRPGEPSNVSVYLSNDGLQFSEGLDLLLCASPIITYLDLRMLKGRGQDAAEFLLENTIRPRWA